MQLNEIIFDEFVRREIEVRRVAGSIGAELNAALADADRETINLLLTQLDAQISLESVIDGITRQRAEAFEEIRDTLLARLRELSTQELEFIAAVSADNDRNFFTTSDAVFAALFALTTSRPANGLSVDDHLRAVEVADSRDIARTIRGQVTAGATPNVISRLLRGTRAGRNENGVFARTKRNVIGTTRTLYTHVRSVALDFTAAASFGEISALRWTSILDGRTSAICRSLSGQEFQPFEGPRPPAHFACRSVMTPIFRRGGEINEPTYSEWLKRQPRVFVERILGKRKAELFLTDNISLDRFVDRTGRERIISEITAST